MGRRVGIYLSWDRALEEAAPLAVLDNRFVALFEARRITWPQLESVSDGARFDQSIHGYLEHVFLGNFQLFRQLVETWTGNPVPILQRRSAAGENLLDAALLSKFDTLIVISFDSQRTGQAATASEARAVKDFLSDPTHAMFVCPHHDIGHTEGLTSEQRLLQQQKEREHHGDHALPGEQRFGGFAMSLMAGTGLPFRNRHGLKPARQPDGSPAQFEVVSKLRHGIMTGVLALNYHPHLPHFE